MKNFIEYLIKEIVDHPEDVKIEESKTDSFVTYIIDVNQEDMGAVIGKGGRMIRSVRNLCKAKAIKDNVHISINLKDGYNIPEEKDETEE